MPILDQQNLEKRGLPQMGGLFRRGGTLVSRAVRAVAAAALASFTDNFTRANENPLSKGGAWINGITGTVNLQIVSNVAFSTAGNGFQIVGTPVFSANHMATTTINGIAGCGVIVRGTSGGSCYLAYVADNVTIQLYTNTNGSGFNSLGSPFTVPTLSNGDTVGLGINGTTLTVYTNGVSRGTLGDGSFSVGSPGLFSNGPGAQSNLFNATDL